MDNTKALKHAALAILVAAMMSAGQVLADKPSHAGDSKGKHGKHDKGGKHDKHSQDDRRDASRRNGEHHGNYFDDRRRGVVNTYYSDQFTQGRCPPGLAKKNNGCMPPGQAKKWSMGQPLSRDVVYYEVPRSLQTQIGEPPAGHRFVRVANDLLLIALGNGKVVDALQNIGRI